MGRDAIRFLQNEEASTVEYLVRVIVVALGATSILFGILAAMRVKGGEMSERIRSFDFGN